MAKPFDNITRRLVEMRPLDWLSFFGIEAESVEMINASLSASIEADRVLKISGDAPQILHLEFQVNYEPMGLRLLRYNVALFHAQKVPVRSVLVLLRPAADGAFLDGVFQIARADGSIYLEFVYEVIRVWQIPVERFLLGTLGLLPFASIAAGVTEENLGTVVREIEERLVREAPTDSEAGDLLFSSFVLMGARFERGFIEKLKAEVRKMRESVFIDIIMDEGRVEGRVEGRTEEALRLILRMGSKRFGEPSTSVRTRLEAIKSTEVLEEIALRLMDVETWDEFLGEQ